MPLLLVLTTLAITSCCLFYWLRDPLRNFPGPRLASITRLYSVAALWYGKEHELILKAHKKYGPVVRWQPNLLLVNNPILLPIIYHHRSEKTPHYNSSTTGVEGIIESKTWQTHRIARTRISQPFTLDAILQDEKLLNESIAAWIHKLDDEHASKGMEFDFTQWPHILGHDINMIRLTGVPMSHVDQTGSYLMHLIKAPRDGAKMTQCLARMPWLRSILFEGQIGNFLMPQPGDKTAVGQVLQFRDGLIEQFCSSTERTGKGRLLDQWVPFICIMIYQAVNPDGSAMRTEEIKEDLTHLFFGGSETVAHAIRATILLISKNPSCGEKLIREINDTTNHMSSINNPDLSTVPYNDLATLPYLNACIRESLRMDSPVTSYLPRYVKPGGIHLGSNIGFVPKGTEIGCSPWVLGRNQDMYGHDADVFRPERFIEDPDRAMHLSKYDFAWGYGNRRCLGKILGMMILRKTIFKVATSAQ
ncbi:cytochrome P450 [Aaosphaeria arxii CBS 175.79]|uniref:Cytochrome P450 n=1 Tax=Aaosphaeria arxii CBS 175.79 TaxID=1450172 RepID=A0A6A5XHS8_9PLEO|nr:cytochrome P450 [Aaosphaeria arxii CBS 175.79]KAF2012416.1 cytochrome P450 [Aaosphaeria arxii CBS 175.79]